MRPPRQFASRNSLPPGGLGGPGAANFPWGGQSENCVPLFGQANAAALACKTPTR